MEIVTKLKEVVVDEDLKVFTEIMVKLVTSDLARLMGREIETITGTLQRYFVVWNI